MNLIMKDQVHRHPNRSTSGNVVIGIITLVTLIATVAILFAASNAIANAEADKLAIQAGDNLMSPERAEFMLLYEHGQVIDEGDLQ